MPRDSLVGFDIAGRFRIVEPLGEGSVGDVYLAEHAVLKRRFAIKLLKRHFLRNATVTERFRREALVASRLDHPSIVEISDFGQTPDGRLYLVMEYVDGPSLGQVIESALPTVVPLKRALQLLNQIASALAAAHDSGVIHRDLKPDNIMVTRDRGGERVKILDFGLAKLMVDAEPLVLTRRGQMFGTPMYMSPEQARGEELDSRTDIYAFGAIAFELLSGRPLFLTDALDQLLVKTQTELPPPPSSVQPLGTVPIPAMMDEVILACMAKDREERPLRMSEVAAVIQRGLKLLRGNTKPYAQTVEYEELELAELKALQAEARTKSEALASVSEARATAVPTPNGEEGDATGGARESVVSSIQVTTIVELDPYYWRRICAAAVQLAQYLQAREQLVPEAVGLLTSLVDMEGRIEVVERELAEPQERLRVIDQACREQEARIRHAVIDLSLQRSEVVEVPDGSAPSGRDLDFQIQSLEQKLAEAYRQGKRQRAEVEPLVTELEDRVDQMRQAQLEVELQLLETLRRHRPDSDSLSLDVNEAFDHLEQLLLEVA